ncbi:MAG: RNA-dependent RNA polymerase [Sanya eysarcoris guttigerus totivirus 1]|nr:MAG: RNA-dependent RNA polymerase [Sanya eysarcoris guttigerus totivirus 1]
MTCLLSSRSQMRPMTHPGRDDCRGCFQIFSPGAALMLRRLPSASGVTPIGWGRRGMDQVPAVVIHRLDPQPVPADVVPPAPSDGPLTIDRSIQQIPRLSQVSREIIQEQVNAAEELMLREVVDLGRQARSLATAAADTMWRNVLVRTQYHLVDEAFRPLVRAFDTVLEHCTITSGERPYRDAVTYLAKALVPSSCTDSIFFHNLTIGPYERSNTTFISVWSHSIVLSVQPPFRARYLQLVIEWAQLVAVRVGKMFAMGPIFEFIDGLIAVQRVVERNPELRPEVLIQGNELDTLRMREVVAIQSMADPQEQQKATLLAALNTSALNVRELMAPPEAEPSTTLLEIMMMMDSIEGTLNEEAESADRMQLMREITKRIYDLVPAERAKCLEHLEAIVKRSAARRLSRTLADADCRGFELRRDGDPDSGEGGGGSGGGGGAPTPPSYPPSTSSRAPPPSTGSGARGGGAPSGSVSQRCYPAPGESWRIQECLEFLNDQECGCVEGGSITCLHEAGGAVGCRLSFPTSPNATKWAGWDRRLRRLYYLTGFCQHKRHQLCLSSLTEPRGQINPILSSFSGVEDWKKAMTHGDPTLIAMIMITHHYGSAGVEHFQQIFSGNFPTAQEWPGFSRSEYEKRRSVVAAWLADRPDTSGIAWLRKFNELLEQFAPGCTERKRDMVKAALVGGMPIQLSAKILGEVEPLLLPLAEAIHNASPDSFEFEICGTAFGWLCLPHEVAFELLCMGIVELPLDKWRSALRGLFDRVSRSQILGKVVGEQVGLVRKLLNLTIRRNEQLDTRYEIRNRCLIATPKLWFFHTAEDWKRHGSPKRRYAHRFVHIAMEMWRTLLSPAIARGDTTRIQEFWDNRAFGVGSGASTLIKKHKQQLADMDERLNSNDRPGKRLMVEMLGDDFLHQVLLKHTPANRGKFFTKPEPGKKLRALYSTFDEESFVAAYVSQGQELMMGKLEGMMVRQTPHDVMRWMLHSSNQTGSNDCRGSYWLSSDYSDYNSEHTIDELRWVQQTMAVVMHEVAERTGLVGWKEKAEAAAWVAASYDNNYVYWGACDVAGWTAFRFHHDGRIVPCAVGAPGWRLTDGFRFTEELAPAPPDRTLFRPPRKAAAYSLVINGMYSGSRDTARNNSLIHWIDVQLAKEMLEEEDVTDYLSVNLCGDDEDIKFRCLGDAVMYSKHIPAVGHRINPAKQMAGAMNHEFLQLQWRQNGKVEKSLNALLSTLASGNWYTQLGVWVQSVLDSCVSNFWEAYSRGMPKRWAQRCAAAYMDRLMALAPESCSGTEYEATGKRLEWWKFRRSIKLPPLFSDTGGECVEPPQYEAAPDVRPTWPKGASEAYVRSQASLLRMLPWDYTREFVQATQLDTIGCAFRTWCQKDAKRWCARFWPARENDWKEALRSNELIRCVEQPDNIAELAISLPQAKRVTSDAMLYGRLGISLFIGRKLGSLRRIAGALPPEKWRHATEVEKETYRLNERGHELQTNIKACLAYSKVPVAKYHAQVVPTRHHKMIYIFMGNGSGKTHLKRVLKKVDDLDEIWTDHYGAFREAFDACIPKSSFSNMSQTMMELITTCQRGNGVLLGQVSPALVQRTAEEHGVPVTCFWHDPGEALRVERMRRRSWSERQVQKRVERARALYQEAKDLGWPELRSPVEIEHVVQAYHAAEVDELRSANLRASTARHVYVFNKTELVTRQLQIDEACKEAEFKRSTRGAVLVY